MPSLEEVKIELHALLKSIDLDKETERSIRSKLVEKLGDVSEYKTLIKEEIENFLHQLPPVEDEVAGGDSDAAEGTGGHGKKRKATEDLVDNDAAYVSKIAKRSASNFYLHLEDEKFLVVDTFKGRKILSIRQYYEKDGELHPTAKGITLDPTQWQSFQQHLAAIITATDDFDEDYVCPLSDLKRVTLVNSRGLNLADVREWYKDKAGELAPGKKGVRLEKCELEKIRDNLPDINAAFNPGPSSKAPQPEASAAETGTSGQGGSVEKAEGGDPGGADGNRDADGNLYFDIGGNKRVKVTSFKGKQYVDFREYYEKGGQLLPGKKGIMLPVDSWQTVCDSFTEVTKALEGRNATFLVELDSKRRLSLSEFKGKLYVGVREYYEKNGEMLPGAKGLNMTPEQWQVVVDNSTTITSAVSQ